MKTPQSYRLSKKYWRIF